MNKVIKLNSLLIVMLIVFFQFSNIFAAYENTNIDLGKYRIYYNKNENRYIKYNSISQRFFDYYYLDNDGNRYPAYCINLGMDGAENGEYDVNVSQKLNDDKLSSIILNGYPYKSLEELGLYTAEEARFATQFAVWVYMSNLNFSLIEPLDSNCIRVVNAIKAIYNNGINSSITSNKVEILNIDDEFKIDDNNPEYYSKRIKLEYNNNVNKISYSSDNDLVKVCDLNNNILESITNQKEVKLLVLRNKILKDTNLNIKFTCNVKENLVMFGISTDANKQNTALALRPIKNDIINLAVNIKYIPTILKISKVDLEDNAIKIPNVKFRILDKNNGNVLGEYITDKNGQITIDTQKEFNYFVDKNVIIQEVETNDEYFLDIANNSYNLKLKVGTENSITIENEKIKGKIKVIKTSGENDPNFNLSNNFLIPDTTFEILDSNGNLVDKITTNNNGIAITKDLPKGIYYIKEVKANEKYVLSDNIYVIEIKNHNDEIVLNVENILIKGKIRIVKSSSEDNEILGVKKGDKIPDTEFEVLDINGNIVDLIVTDKDGIAITKDLPKGTYYIKEVKANEKYILDEKIYTVLIKEHREIVELNIENDLIKGKIKIIKTSNESNEDLGISKGDKISNTEFEILDEKENIVDKVITDEEGIAITKELPKGKYYIKETKSNSSYILSSNVYEVNIDKDKKEIVTNIGNDCIEYIKKLPNTGK